MVDTVFARDARRMRAPLRIAVIAFVFAGLAACSPARSLNHGAPPEIGPSTPVGLQIEQLPGPARALDVGVYAFPDLTGAHKPNDDFAEYSRAVTQGGDAFLVDALTRVGGGAWFNVVERNGLDDILQERRLILGTRETYQQNGSGLRPLRFAGMLLNGGIIAYNANTATGGAGAKLLGIGGDVQYRQDLVTVALRAVSVNTGKVLASVTTSKTIYSVAANASAFRFVSVDRLLEAEAGASQNEPPQLAVQQAVQLAVLTLVLEGATKGLWAFADPEAVTDLMTRYQSVRSGGGRLEVSEASMGGEGSTAQ